MGDILDHPTLGRPQPSVAYTLLVPADIRATTRRYGEVSRTQITLCHATVRQLRYPNKISLPILIKFAFSLWCGCQSFFHSGLRHRISRDCGKQRQKSSGDYPVATNFEPIFIRSSSLCCVARQKCSIIGNEKKKIPFSKNEGHLSHFAGHLMKCGTVPPNAGRLTDSPCDGNPLWRLLTGEAEISRRLVDWVGQILEKIQ